MNDDDRNEAGLQDLRARFGSARRPDREPARAADADLTPALTRALGKLSEALEVVESARGLLYQFHRMSGTADLTLKDALAQLRDAGEPELADEISQVLVGRDVIAGMWTFQIVEAYDSGYWQVFRACELKARRACGADKHLYEAGMKVDEQAAGTAPHQADAP